MSGVRNQRQEQPEKKRGRGCLILVGAMLLVVVLSVIFVWVIFNRFAADFSFRETLQVILQQNGESERDLEDSKQNGSHQEVTTPAPVHEDESTAEQLKDNEIAALLGKSMEEIMELYGEPELIDFYSASWYHSYIDSHGILFYYSEELAEEDIVVGISLVKDSDILGTRVGMTVSEVKSILGNPFDEGYDEAYSPPYYLLCYLFEGVHQCGIKGRQDVEIYFYASSPDAAVEYIDIYCK